MTVTLRTQAGRAGDAVATATAADWQHRNVISVSEAADVLGIGRSAAYECVARGEIPSLRLGRRLVVPVPRLCDLLGIKGPINAVAEAAVDQAAKSQGV